MATLQKIRNRAGLLVVVIGFAMLAFILTDFMSSGQSLFADGNDLGKIDGTTVTYQDFERQLESIMVAKYPNGATDEQRSQERDQLWDTRVRETLLQDHYASSGVRVGKEELEDLMTGSRTGKLDPIAQQLFGIQGAAEQPNAAQISQLIQRVMETDPKGARTYVYYEDLIRKNRLNEKYFNLLKKGLYVTDLEAARQYNFTNGNINGRYVQLALTTILDSTVTVTDAERKKYYQENKKDYKADASRDLSYVVFDVKPSQADFNLALEEITGLVNDRVAYNRNTASYDTIPGFANTADDSSFVMANSDANAPFNSSYIRQDGTLPADLEAQMFSEEVGYMVGPYLEDGAYKVAKLSDVMMRPDSVEARHILVKGGENPDPVAAKALADSLFAAIEAGSDFAELAKEFSEDPGSGAKGGDLGYFGEGAMVVPFNNACFNGKTGDLVMVASQFGYHIIEITGQKGSSKAVRVAIISREVLASNETADQIYTEASSFVGNNRTVDAMIAAADSLGLQVQQAANLRADARSMAGLQKAREIVRWAFDETTSKGDVRMFDRNDQLVVVGLTKVQEEGYTNIEDLGESLDNAVRREKKKELLMAKANEAYADGISLDDFAAATGTTVRSFSGVQFANPSVSGAGFEPAWVGHMFAHPLATTSKPFKGNNGVYVFVLDQNNAAIESTNLLTQKATIKNGIQPRAEFQIFNDIKEKAEVEDNRASVY